MLVSCKVIGSATQMMVKRANMADLGQIETNKRFCLANRQLQMLAQSWSKQTQLYDAINNQQKGDW